MSQIHRTTVIGEIGINWFGDTDLAKEMIDFCKESEADIAKFQFYRPEELLGKDSPYLLDASRGALTKETVLEFKNYCDSKEIEFGLSVFHPDLVDFTEEMNLKRYKIGSRCFTDRALLERVNETRKPVIASMGSASERNIYKSLDYLRDCPNITLLSCVCNYPTRIDSINLAQLDMARNILKNVGRKESVGFSSHCPKISPSLAAVARGASVIENHIVKYKSMKGCDVSSSLNFDEFKKMVKMIREVEQING